MSSRPRALITAFLAGAYLMGLGCLVGIVVERVRYDRARAEVMGRYGRALETTHAALMQLEREAAATRPTARVNETPARSPR